MKVNELELSLTRTYEAFTVDHMAFMKNYLWYYESKLLYFEDLPIFYSKIFKNLLGPFTVHQIFHK